MKSNKDISFNKIKYILFCYDIDLLTNKPITLHIDPNFKLSLIDDDDPIDNSYVYKRLIGKLIHLNIFKIYITFTVCKLIQYMKILLIHI